MRFVIGTGSTSRFRNTLQGILEPEQAATAMEKRIGQLIRQGLAVVLSALMIMIPMGQSQAYAQQPLPIPPQESAPPPDSQVPQGQPLSADQLDQLVAPMALYPDALVAQVLAAATYPTQVVEADRWRQAQGNAPAERIAAGAEAQNWDPSVKALTAFPTVLAQMDKNIQWTTDLGNAYYNQPQDVMDSVQAMRLKAQSAGQLRSTPQQTVTNEGGTIAIAPANPTVVYVPVYDPWTVYGGPIVMYPGFYYAPPPGIFWGGLAIGFGIGIGIGIWGHYGWGWGHWGMGWHDHAVFYNRGAYFTRSTTVINRGFSRPGGPAGRGFGARGAYARPAGGYNRGAANRGAYGAGRPGAYGRPGGAAGRPGGARPMANSGRPGGAPRANGPGAGAGTRPGGGRPAAAGRPGGASGTSHPSNTGHSATGHASGGGHSGGGEKGKR